MSDRRSASILRLQSVSLEASIGSSLLLEGISFNIDPGSKVAVVGASGAGKTSLLRLLNRLVSPSEGKIDFPGSFLPSIALRRSVVLVPQEPKLLGMKVIDALKYPLQLQQLPKPEVDRRIETWTNLLRIPKSWFNKTELQLSLGQRQIIAIARALIMQPKVLLLDEPTSALDVGTATDLLRVLNDVNQSQNLTIVMVNHQLELIGNFCDRILYLNGGRLAADLPSNQANWQAIEQELLQLKTQQQQEWD